MQDNAFLEISGYTWTVQQIECATDIMFRKPEYLAPIYDEIIRTAIYTVKPDNIATFFGQRITYNCTKESGTNYNQRILGGKRNEPIADSTFLIPVICLYWKPSAKGNT